MIISRFIRATALVDINSQFEVDEAEFDALIAEGMTDEEAFDSLRSDCKAEPVMYNSSVDEVLMIHETDTTLL